jgi:hypothetical protein
LKEFLRRWEELPELKNAELVDGVVYVPSPVSRQHGSLDTLMIWWLAQYAQATPGCEAGNNSTWLILGSAAQPDTYLRILPQISTASSGAPVQYGSSSPDCRPDDDGAKMLSALNAGLASEEHRQFVARLAAAR